MKPPVPYYGGKSRIAAAARGNRMPHVDEVIWSNRELAAPARLFEVSR